MGTHQRSQAATLVEVAARAGVSRTTASRVLNGHPSVRDSVRERVQAAMEELHYVPDRLARGLRRGRTGIIALVIPQPAATVFSDAFFAALVSAVVHAGQRHDVMVAMILVSPEQVRDATGPDAPDEARLGDAADARLLDGALVAASIDDDRIVRWLSDRGLPVVVIGDLGLADVDSVDVDNEAGARMAVDHLVDAGRRRFVVVEGPATSPAARTRARAARLAIEDAGASNACTMPATTFSFEAGRHAMQEVLATIGPDQFDAVVAGSDAIAAGVQAVLDDHRLRVPADVAVVGFDDLPPARSTAPRLTTIHQPITGVAERAVDRLLELVGESPDAPRREVLPVRLVRRSST